MTPFDTFLTPFFYRGIAFSCTFSAFSCPQINSINEPQRNRTFSNVNDNNLYYTFIGLPYLKSL